MLTAQANVWRLDTHRTEATKAHRLRLQTRGLAWISQLALSLGGYVPRMDMGSKVAPPCGDSVTAQLLEDRHSPLFSSSELIVISHGGALLARPFFPDVHANVNSCCTSTCRFVHRGRLLI